MATDREGFECEGFGYFGLLLPTTITATPRYPFHLYLLNDFFSIGLPAIFVLQCGILLCNRQGFGRPLPTGSFLLRSFDLLGFSVYLLFL